MIKKMYDWCPFTLLQPCASHIRVSLSSSSSRGRITHEQSLNAIGFSGTLREYTRAAEHIFYTFRLIFTQLASSPIKNIWGNQSFHLFISLHFNTCIILERILLSNKSVLNMSVKSDLSGVHSAVHWDLSHSSSPSQISSLHLAHLT